MQKLLFALVIGFLTALPLLPASAKLSCTPTPSIKADRPVLKKNMTPTNNLRSSIGSPVVASGTPILIKGRLLDKKCIPISDAVVELWQADSEGRFTTLPKGRDGFSGSGTTLTNNMGEFTFLTIMPGAYEERDPHIHLHIHHPEFDRLNTDIFFSKDALTTDPLLQKVLPSLRQNLIAKKASAPTGEAVYSFDITMDAEGQYRKF